MSTCKWAHLNWIFLDLQDCYQGKGAKSAIVRRFICLSLFLPYFRDWFILLYRLPWPLDRYRTIYGYCVNVRSYLVWANLLFNYSICLFIDKRMLTCTTKLYWEFHHGLSWRWIHLNTACESLRFIVCVLGPLVARRGWFNVKTSVHLNWWTNLHKAEKWLREFSSFSEFRNFSEFSSFSESRNFSGFSR